LTSVAMLSKFSTSWMRVHPKPFDIIEKVNAYMRTFPSKPQDARYSQAVKRVQEYFRLPKPVPCHHINDVMKYYPHPERSPGLPYTQEGFRRKDEVDPNRYKHFVHRLKYNIYKRCATPCNAVAKSMVGPTPKFRLVWVYPAHMTFAEGIFAQPLIRAYKHAKGPYALWVKYAKGDMRRLRLSRPPTWTWLGLDWKAFDVNVPSWLIREAFAILRPNLDFSKYYEWGAPTDPDTLPRLWNRCIEYFINTPIKLPTGKVVRKRNGVPSGSYFTNLVDTIVNAIMVEYLLDQYKRSNATYYMGDDSLIALPSKVDLEELAERALHTFGAILNPDKSELGEYVSFLGYRMHKSGIPQASYEKLIAQLLLPSKPDRSNMDIAVRMRALQLSSFGIGCRQFYYETQSVLDEYGYTETVFALSQRNELSCRLEHLGLHINSPVSQLYLSM